MNKKLIPTGGNDIVMTPPSLAKAVIDRFNPIGVTLEPCRGGGAFYDQFPNAKDWCEITQGRDFFEYNQRVEWIITNPPFGLMRKFLMHSMEISEHIVFLCPINHIIGLKARLRDIKGAGFYIREIAQINTPKEFPQSGFQWAANYLNKEKGNIKVTKLNYGQ